MSYIVLTLMNHCPKMNRSGCRSCILTFPTRPRFFIWIRVKIKFFLDFTLNAGLKKIMKENWTWLLRPALISHCEWWGLILKCRGFLRVLNNKQSVIIRYQVTWTIHPNHQAHTLGECCQGKSVWKEADLDSNYLRQTFLVTCIKPNWFKMIQLIVSWGS